MGKPYTIGITGGSASGKTFFLQHLSSEFSSGEICLLSQDHYYFPRDIQPQDENGVRNFDLPESIDREALYADLMKLKAGEVVHKKEYTFNNPAITAQVLEFKPAPLLIVEGLFVCYFKEINLELDLKIFIEAKDHVRLGRRIRRDQQERGYGLDDVLYRYERHVMPVYERLIEPLKHIADFIIPNNSHNDQAARVVAGYLKNRL